MSKCQDCESNLSTAEYDDPRDPPINTGICLCSECYKTALAQCLNESIDNLNDLIRTARPFLGCGTINCLLENIQTK